MQSPIPVACFGCRKCSQQQAKVPNGPRDHHKGLSANILGLQPRAVIAEPPLRASVADLGSSSTAFGGRTDVQVGSITGGTAEVSAKGQYC